MKTRMASVAATIGAFFYITSTMHGCAATQEEPLVVATVCMNAKSDKEANLEKYAQYMNRAASAGAHLVVFPEVSLQQNPGWGTSEYTATAEEAAYVRATAEPVPGETTALLVGHAQELGILVVFGMTELGSDGELYNTSVFLGPGGVVEAYRKHRLWDSDTGGNEHRTWTPGPIPGVVVDTPIGMVGLMICVEMHHGFGPSLAASGAQLLVTVSAWPASFGSYYESATVDNAKEAALWHVISNQVGNVGHAVDYGHSRIVDPTGAIIADTGGEEGIVVSETNLLIDPGMFRNTASSVQPVGRGERKTR